MGDAQTSSLDYTGAITPISKNKHGISNVEALTSVCDGFSFNAHLSNSIYTDSGKVYPLSLALNFIIKC